MNKYDEYRKAFGQMILIGMNAKGWTNQQFAERIGNHPQEIYNWIHHTPNFKIRNIIKIEIELDITLINVK